MSPKARKVIEEALALPVEARAALAARLIESLDEAIDPGAEAAWDAEISRRVHELDDGSVRPVPWGEIRRTVLGRRDESGRR
jgi:putative addiction module component (TIGR02574 family)